MADRSPPAPKSENGQLLDMLLHLIDRLEKSPVPTGRSRRQRSRRARHTSAPREQSPHGPTHCLLPHCAEGLR
jgi:hypothetical protein